MTSRKPNKNALPHTVTVWNWTGNETVLNGAKVKEFNKVYVNYARYDKTSMIADSAIFGNIYLEIYNGVNVVTNAKGEFCKYVEPEVYLNASDKSRLWTINTGDDYLGLGKIFDKNPSFGGERARKDYVISACDEKYGYDGLIHHWEVNGK
ncbi:MAG: hypothetical protein FWF15_05140 [Oscillospiraceae bacterium]|nr:hypothetical protein [Oscillospiraceae bacterium]